MRNNILTNLLFLTLVISCVGCSENHVDEPALKQVTVDTDELALKRVAVDSMTFVIRNENLFDIKDMEIVCTHFAGSGAQIGSDTRMIREVIPARSWRQIRFNMVSNNQIARTSCRAAKLIPIMVDPAVRQRERQEAEAEIKSRAAEAATAKARKKGEEAKSWEDEEARRKEDEARFNCSITSAQFSSLQAGMSYGMAERALNCSGRKISSSIDLGGRLTSVYSWKVEGSDADATATFRNTRLKSTRDEGSATSRRKIVAPP